MSPCLPVYSPVIRHMTSYDILRIIWFVFFVGIWSQFMDGQSWDVGGNMIKSTTSTTLSRRLGRCHREAPRCRLGHGNLLTAFGNYYVNVFNSCFSRMQHETFFHVVSPDTLRVSKHVHCWKGCIPLHLPILFHVDWFNSHLNLIKHKIMKSDWIYMSPWNFIGKYTNIYFPFPWLISFPGKRGRSPLPQDQTAVTWGTPRTAGWWWIIPNLRYRCFWMYPNPMRLQIEPE